MKTSHSRMARRLVSQPMINISLRVARVWRCRNKSTLKVSWDSSDDDPDDTKETTEEADTGLADKESLEVYAVEEMKAIENHVEQHFGTFEKVFHEHDSQGIVPPSGERDYCSLVTMGMGAHRMNVPSEFTEGIQTRTCRVGYCA